MIQRCIGFLSFFFFWCVGFLWLFKQVSNFYFSSDDDYCKNCLIIHRKQKSPSNLLLQSLPKHYLNVSRKWLVDCFCDVRGCWPDPFLIRFPISFSCNDFSWDWFLSLPWSLFLWELQNGDVLILSFLLDLLAGMFL